MARMLEIKTSNAELHQTLPLTSDEGETLTMKQLQAAAAALLPDKQFSLRYTDSDGDHVTITSDADVKELEKYMQEEQVQILEVLVVPQEPATAKTAANVVQTQLRGLVTAMSKLTAKPETNPTPASAMNLLVTSLQAMDVADDAEELTAIKKELLLVLQDETFRKAVEELSATEEFKEVADTMVAAIYEGDAQAIEDAATARFDELLVFVQRAVASCPSLKPAVVNVAKSLMTGLVRYNDEEMDGNASDSSSCSSSSSCCDDRETVDVEVLTEEVPLHLGVACDGCEQAPLVGVRYKSLEAPNFDLCEHCEASGKYTHYEPFIKITDPSRAPKQKRTSEPVHVYVTCDGCEESPIVGVRFKSQTKDDFDLCAACEASGKWTESHGPFTKIEEPATMRALKFTCRRGGKFGRHGKFGHHRHGHGHHGKFRHGGHHHGDEGKFGRHGHHHGPPGFAFHGHHHGPPGFPGHGFPFHHEGRPEFPGHGRPDFHGRPPFEFDDRRHHHGPPGFGPSGFFGRFGPHPFEFADPRGSPMCPRGFEHGRPPFPAEFEHLGFHGHHHGRHHGRHTKSSDDEGEDSKKEEGRRHRGRRGRHGCGRGRGRWGSDVTNDHVSHTNTASNETMEIDETTRAQEHKTSDTEGKVDYTDSLMQLTSMGFDDAEKNIRALELADGNIGGAVNALLSN